MTDVQRQELCDSPVTWWYADKPREVLLLSPRQAVIYVIDEPQTRTRLGDGTPERKEDALIQPSNLV